MRRIGSGYAGMKRFLVLMNHPSSMTEQNYRKLSSVYRNSVKEVAETVMQEAALEIYNKNTLIVMITLLILVFLLMVPGINVDLLPLMVQWPPYLRNWPYFGCGSEDTLLSGVVSILKNSEEMQIFTKI